MPLPTNGKTAAKACDSASYPKPFFHPVRRIFLAKKTSILLFFRTCQFHLQIHICKENRPRGQSCHPLSFSDSHGVKKYICACVPKSTFHGKLPDNLLSGSKAVNSSLAHSNLLPNNEPLITVIVNCCTVFASIKRQRAPEKRLFMQPRSDKQSSPGHNVSSFRKQSVNMQIKVSILLFVWPVSGPVFPKSLEFRKASSSFHVSFGLG
jgi:hypothetical protein